MYKKTKIYKKMKKLLKFGRTKYFLILAVAKFNEIFFKEIPCTKKTKQCSKNRKSRYLKCHNVGKNIPICCATHLYEMLKDTVRCLEKNNIKYFIAYGTLLGAVRHKGLIPWDNDLDLIILDKDSKRVYELLNKSFKDKYHITSGKFDGIGSDVLIRVDYSAINSLHIDLFPCKTDKENIYVEHNDILKYKKIFPLQKIKFYDIEVFAPNDIQYCLDYFYGKGYMEYACKQWMLSDKKTKITDFSPAKIKLN